MGQDPIHDLQQQIAAAKEGSTILPKPEKPEKNEPERVGLRAGGELIGGIMGGLLFGYCADMTFETRPFGMVIGLFLGVIGGFYGVYRIFVQTK